MNADPVTRPGKDLVGKPLITIDEGRFLGNVKDIHLDQEATLLVALHLGRSGLIRRKDLFFLRQSIHVFGVDAVLVKNKDSQTDSQAVPESEHWLKLNDLRGMDVDTAGSTRVGTIDDIVIDAEARIIGFTLRRVFVEGPLKQARGFRRSAVITLDVAANVMTIDLAQVEQDLNQRNDS